MEDLKEKTKHHKYRNWIKCTLGLVHTKRGLHEYVNEKFLLFVKCKSKLNSPVQAFFNQDELTHIEYGGHFRLEFSKNVKKINGKWKWKNKETCNGKFLCKTSFNKILALHKEYENKPNGGLSAQMFWENADNSDHLSLGWSIAKMFMPHGNQTNKGPDDTDPAAMLHIMEVCDLFTNPVRMNNVKALIKVRNELSHSTNNFVGETETEKYFESMKILLSEALHDPEIGQEIRQTINAHIERLDKLKTSEMTVSMYDDALKAKRKAIHDDFQKYLYDNDTKQLELLLTLAEKTTAEIQEINSHLQDIQLNAQYKNRIEELHLDESKAECEKVIIQLNQSKINLEVLEKLLEENQNTIKQKNDQLEGRKNTIQQQKEQLDESKNTIQQQKEQLEERKNTIQQHKEQLEESKNTIQQQKKQLEESKNTIQQQKKQLEESKNTIQQQKNQLEESKNTIQQQKKQLEKSKNTIEQQKKQLEESKNTIQQQKKQLEE